jgi:hypothetical protein
VGKQNTKGQTAKKNTGKATKKPATKKKATPKKKQTKADIAKEDQKRTVLAKARMLVALRKYLGIVSPALKAANVARTTHYKWMNEDPDYKQGAEDINETAIDEVEFELIKKIKGFEYDDTFSCSYQGKVTTKKIKKSMPPDTKAIIFYLETKGKQRGYTKSIEHINMNRNPDADKTDKELLQELNELRKKND